MIKSNWLHSAGSHGQGYRFTPEEADHLLQTLSHKPGIAYLFAQEAEPRRYPPDLRAKIGEKLSEHGLEARRWAR